MLLIIAAVFCAGITVGSVMQHWQDQSYADGLRHDLAEERASHIADMKADCDRIEAEIAILKTPKCNGENGVIAPDPLPIGWSYFDGTNTHTYMGNGGWNVTTVFRSGGSVTPAISYGLIGRRDPDGVAIDDTFITSTGCEVMP